MTTQTELRPVATSLPAATAAASVASPRTVTSKITRGAATATGYGAVGVLMVGSTGLAVLNFGAELLTEPFRRRRLDR